MPNRDRYQAKVCCTLVVPRSDIGPGVVIQRKPATTGLVADGMTNGASMLLGYVGQVITLGVPLMGYSAGSSDLMISLATKPVRDTTNSN